MAQRVTLTFDNGPTPEVTPQVLDCLARNDPRRMLLPGPGLQKTAHFAGTRGR
jgi:hypothetical protein